MVFARPTASCKVADVEETFVDVEHSEVLLKVVKELACIQRTHYEAARTIGLGIEELDLRVRHVVATAHYLSNKEVAYADIMFFFDSPHNLLCLPNAFVFLLSNGIGSQLEFGLPFSFPVAQLIDKVGFSLNLLNKFAYKSCSYLKPVCCLFVSKHVFAYSFPNRFNDIRRKCLLLQRLSSSWHLSHRKF